MVFADAGYYIALGSARDQHHAVAKEFLLSYDGQTITSEYVLLEVGTFLSSAIKRMKFEELVQQLRADAGTEIVASSSELWQRGLQLYNQRPDKNWSLTDCISFVVMQERGLTEALSADRHFEQAGFTILLK